MNTISADFTVGDTSMPSPAATPSTAIPDTAAFLAHVGTQVRAARTGAGLSRRAVAERAAISQRYLAQIESGAGNMSIALLYRVAAALGQPIEVIVGSTKAPGDPRAGRICLIGLRGAGKSTLGRMASSALDLPFRELTREVELLSGMPVADVIALYGPQGYRKIERQALERIASAEENVILAVAGGIVSDQATYGLLLSRFHTVWLKASPHEHMDRVRAQGDERPMAGNPRAMEDLVALLASREIDYARAEARVDTSGRSTDQSLRDLLNVIDGFAPSGYSRVSRSGTGS